MVDKILLKINGKQYVWCGWGGCIMESYENDVNEGDTRVMNNRLFYVFSVHRSFFKKNRVCWNIIDNTHDKMKELKYEFLGSL